MVLGHHSSRRHSLASSRGSTDETRDTATTAEDETIVDADQGNVLTHIISQLRPGADLSRVTLPTFILEPRSMLERITNFMAHPETLLPMPAIEDPTERFVSVVKFYLSGWHIKPPGVKKPLNPILGETFTGYWDYPDGTRGYYISEQTSHHPPKSSYFYMAPEHHIRIDGTLKPRSKFLGNSAASMMEGIAVMRFLNRGERYFVTQPNIYSRGILFGKMKYELGDHSFVRSPELGLMADIEFKTKGWVGGTYNAIGGYIKEIKTDRNLFELSGFWNGEMYIKNLTTGKKTLLFDATHAKETLPLTRPIEEMDERESQRLWQKVTKALKQRDHDVATEEKSKIEDQQRHEAAERAEQGVEWHPSLFGSTHGSHSSVPADEVDLDFIINAKIDGRTPDEITQQVLAIAAIIPGQKHERQFDIPERKPTQEAALQEPKRDHSPDPTRDVEEKSAQVQSQFDLLNLNASDARPAIPAKQQEQIEQKKADPLGDLIDFGQHEVPARAQIKDTNARSQPLPESQPQTGSVRETVFASKHVGSSGHQEQLGKIKRQDSQTSELDEFVDAES